MTGRRASKSQTRAGPLTPKISPPGTREPATFQLRPGEPGAVRPPSKAFDAGRPSKATNKRLAERSKSRTGFPAMNLNMNWHHPNLYFLLGLLTGLAAFLAIIYEGIQKFRRQPV